MAAPPASTGSEKGSGSREGTTKAMVAEQMSQSIQSTSNLIHLMQQTSSAQNELMKLPKNLLAKASVVKNTGQMVEQMPCAISSLDAYTENGLQSVPHLKTVIKLLENFAARSSPDLFSRPIPPPVLLTMSTYRENDSLASMQQWAH